MAITTLQRWFLKRITREVVRQGNHRSRIIEFYRLLVDAAREEFTEDNKPTLDCFLEECHREALESKEK